MCHSRGIALSHFGANATLLALELVLDGEGRCGREAGDQPGCTVLTASLFVRRLKFQRLRWSPYRRLIQTAQARKLPSKFDGKPETINPR